MKTTKKYILEGHLISKGSVISLKEEESHTDKFNNFLLTPEGGMLSEEELRAKANGIFDEVRKKGLISDYQGASVQYELFQLIKVHYARYMRLPNFEQVEEFLRTYHKNFAT